MRTNHNEQNKCQKCDYSHENKNRFNLTDGSLECLVCLSLKSESVDNDPIASQIKALIVDEKRYQQGLLDAESLKVLNFEQARKTKLLEKCIFPKDVGSFLNKHIIGQESAKNKISIAVSNHLQRINNPKKKIQKSNILLIGPSGSGKTEMFRHISKLLDVPFSSFDATTLTASGYVGMDVDQILVPLLNDSETPYQAQRGIVFIDEIDKIAGGGNEGAVNTIRVQQELLKLIEGSVVKVNRTGDKNRPQYIDIDTSNILFICAGAFQGLEKLVEATDERSMGIGSSLDQKDMTTWEEKLETKHFVKFGLITELLGRLPVVAYTKELQVNDLVKILTEPENSLTQQYVNLFDSYNVKITFSKEFLTNLAAQAHSQKIGARGLKRVFEKSLESLFLNIHNYHNKSITVNMNSIEEDNLIELEQG